MKLFSVLFGPALAGIFLFSGALRAADLTVYAAASLSDALRDVANTYESRTSDKVHFNFGASSTLARQIKEGAPADVFFSADEAKMDDLAKANLITTETRRTLLSNTLVIVVPASASEPVASPTELAGPGIHRIALAETQTVPAGIYAKEYLQTIGLWNKVSAKVVPTENVRACLEAVASGNVDAGIVYKTDALITKRVKIAYEIPMADGPKIAYPAALVKGGKHAPEAGRFLDFLSSNVATSIFNQYGFLPARK